MSKKKERSEQLESPSYMEMRFDEPGKKVALFLRIPTFWDAVNNQWLGAFKTPSGKLIHASGKDSFELQNNFNIAFSHAFEDEETGKEIYDMFKPLEWWEAYEK